MRLDDCESASTSLLACATLGTQIPGYIIYLCPSPDFARLTQAEADLFAGYMIDEHVVGQTTKIVCKL